MRTWYGPTGQWSLQKLRTALPTFAAEGSEIAANCSRLCAGQELNGSCRLLFDLPRLRCSWWAALIISCNQEPELVVRPQLCGYPRDVNLSWGVQPGGLRFSELGERPRVRHSRFTYTWYGLILLLDEIFFFPDLLKRSTATHPRNAPSNRSTAGGPGSPNTNKPRHSIAAYFDWSANILEAPPYTVPVCRSTSQYSYLTRASLVCRSR